LLEPEEEEQPESDVAKPHEDAPMRKLPAMSSTGVTEGQDAFSEKERTPIERAMQREVQRVFSEFAPEAEDAVANEEEVDYNVLKAALVAVLVTYLVRAFMDQVAELEAEYDVSFDPADMAVAANDWATSFAPEEADRLIGTTRKVVDGVAAKYAAGEIVAGQIDELLEPAFSKSRSELIAITLITAALSMATDDYVAGLKGLGLEVVEVWYTQDDERVCSICRPLHGKKRGDDWSDPPPAHGRCRCYRTLEIRRIM